MTSLVPVVRCTSVSDSIDPAASLPVVTNGIAAVGHHSDVLI